MRLKEIKPGMVIHCKSIDEKKALYDELCRIGNMKTDSYTDSLDNFTNADCNYRIGNLKRETWSFTTDRATVKFSDLIILDQELSAEEALLAYDQMCKENYCCNDCPIYGILGHECVKRMDGHISEIMDAIKKWKAEREKKEPEIEWFWKSYVVGGSDCKEADTEQDAMEWCEYYAKEHPEAKCTYRHVCRVKAVE